MKRDWDLLRKQLTDIEDERDVLADMPDTPKWSGQPGEDYERQLKEFIATEARIFGHLELLIDNRFVTGIEVKRNLNGEFIYYSTSPQLTMSGHDLLDTMRSSSIWESIKSMAKSKGIELTFDAIKSLGLLALKQVVGSS